MNRATSCAILATASLAATCALGWTQTQIACNITRVTVEQLSNAVQITLKADGLPDVSHEMFDFVETTDQRQWRQRWRSDMPLHISNARSQVGTFIDIGLYPVNYLELSTPADSREGVGLDLRLVLYKPAIFRQTLDWFGGEADWQEKGVVFDYATSPSGRDLVLTVWSDRREEPVVGKKARRELDLPAELEVESADGRLCVTALNAPLETMMARVSEATGVPVFVDDRVQRLASVHLADVGVEQFIDSIAAGYGLTAVKSDGAYLVSDGLPSSLGPYTTGETRTFHLKYIEAHKAINLLPNFLIRYLRPSASNDAIVAQGPKRLLQRIEQDLAALDKPVRAVRLRTVIAEARDITASRRLWRLLRGGDHTTVSLDIDTGSLRFERGERPLDRYVAAIRALASRGRVEVQVQPALVVLPGASAEVFVGERQYFQYVSASGRDGGLQLSLAEAGVRLSCQPRAMGSGLIQNRISLEVSTLRRGSGGLPAVDRRTIEGTALLQSGDTVILGGGLYLHQEEQERRGPLRARWLGPLRPLTEGRLDDGDLRELVFLLCAEHVDASELTAQPPT